MKKDQFFHKEKKMKKILLGLLKRLSLQSYQRLNNNLKDKDFINQFLSLSLSNQCKDKDFINQFLTDYVVKKFPSLYKCCISSNHQLLQPTG